MKKILLTTISMVMMLTAFVSCEKEEEYVAPFDIRIALTPNPCSPGDTVFCQLTYGVNGENWYWYSQKFSTPSPLFKEFRGSCDEPSRCYFIAPEESGNYTVGFKGQVTKTVGKDLWGDAIEIDAKLIVK